MLNLLMGIFLLIGTSFSVVAAVGILRLPDLYTRMHAATKAGTVGLAFILLAVALWFQDLTVSSRVLGIMVFIILTTPVGAHLLGKAMLDKGYPLHRKGKKAGS